MIGVIQARRNNCKRREAEGWYELYFARKLRQIVAHKKGGWSLPSLPASAGPGIYSSAKLTLGREADGLSRSKIGFGGYFEFSEEHVYSRKYATLIDSYGGSFGGFKNFSDSAAGVDDSGELDGG